MVDMAPARAVLHDLIRESPHTFKYVASEVGEGTTILSDRLRSTPRPGYGQLDLGLVLSILDVLGVTFTEYARRVEDADRGA